MDAFIEAHFYAITIPLMIVLLAFALYLNSEARRAYNKRRYDRITDELQDWVANSD